MSIEQRHTKAHSKIKITIVKWGNHMKYNGQREKLNHSFNQLTCNIVRSANHTIYNILTIRNSRTKDNILLQCCIIGLIQSIDTTSTNIYIYCSYYSTWHYSLLKQSFVMTTLSSYIRTIHRQWRKRMSDITERRIRRNKGKR